VLVICLWPAMAQHVGVTELDVHGRSRLHYTALDGDEGAVAGEIAAGANVNLADKAVVCPLHFAGRARAARVTQALLDAGADVDVEDRHGNTRSGLRSSTPEATTGS
jgi:ankyrin repeat protein